MIHYLIWQVAGITKLCEIEENLYLFYSKYNLYILISVISVIKSWRMWWTGHVARMEEMKMNTNFRLPNLKIRDHSEELDVDETIIVKWILGK